MGAYCKLNEDYIFQNIMNTDMFYHTLPPDEQPKWDQAKNLLEKIQKNQLPACLGHLTFETTDERDEFWGKTEGYKKRICAEVNQKVDLIDPLTPEHLVFKKVQHMTGA